MPAQTMRLRPRQVEAVKSAVDALKEKDNTLLIAPTGAGKTVMLSAVGGQIGGCGMILQHRDELVAQNHQTFRRLNPDWVTGFLTAGSKTPTKLKEGVTFGMIQTAARNLDAIPKLDWLTVDEAHHSAAATYRRVIEEARKKNPGLKLFGVTATPNRGDSKGLVGVFDNVCDEITLSELIATGHLVRPRTFVVDAGQGDVTGVKKVGGEFDMAAVEAIMDKRVVNTRVVDEWERLAQDRQTVAFCSTVAHAEHVRDAFLERGIKAALVHGDMSETDRRSTLAAYDRGEIQVLTNVAVLTEGWDHQPTSCVLLLRPSSYKSTMLQMVGRGLRKVDPERYPGVVKNDCIVIDFGCSILLHGSFEQEAKLDGAGKMNCPHCSAIVPSQTLQCPICGETIRMAEQAPVKICKECGEPNHPSARACISCHSPFPEKLVSELSEFIVTERQILDLSPFRWSELFNGLVMVAEGFTAWAVLAFLNGTWFAVGGGNQTGVKLLAVQQERMAALQSADDWMREHGDADSASKSRRWMNLPATDKQLAQLRMSAIEAHAHGINRYSASCLLTFRFNEKVIERRIKEHGITARAA